VVLLGRDAEGKNRYNAVDNKNNAFVKDFIKNGSAPGGGYTDYWFVKKDGGEPMPKRSYTLLFEPFGWVVGTGNYIDDISIVVGQARNEIEAAVSRSVAVLYIVLPIMIAAGVIASIFFGKRISRPIVVISDQLDSISREGGDLTVTLPVDSKDETGKLAGSFNRFTEALRGIVFRIKQGTDTLSETGEDLASNLAESSAAVNQINGNVRNTRDRIIDQSSNVTETAAVVEQMTKNIESLDNMIENQAAGITESSSAIEEMISSMASITGTAERADKNVNELASSSANGKTKLNQMKSEIEAIARSSEKLMEANSLIENIASQTNLLAMNAAIEAAHAGESGKGFAVVADEIRKLAEMSAVQANAVREDIDGITRAIGTVVGVSKETETEFTNIIDAINVVKNTFLEVKNAMVEQSAGSNQVLEALQSMRDISVSVQSGSEEMTGGIKQMLESITTLSEITEEIKNSIEEISRGSEEIQKAVSAVADMGTRNREAINQVVTETEKFTV
jgi:methyl-accepting chemotaxis protein